MTDNLLANIVVGVNSANGTPGKNKGVTLEGGGNAARITWLEMIEPLSRDLVVVASERPITSVDRNRLLSDPDAVWVAGVEIGRYSPVEVRFETGDLMFLTLVNCVPERESEFNHWYNARHLPDVHGAGLQSGVRYRMNSGLQRNLAIYKPASMDVFTSQELQDVRGFDHLAPHVSDLTRIKARVCDTLEVSKNGGIL